MPVLDSGNYGYMHSEGVWWLQGRDNIALGHGKSQLNTAFVQNWVASDTYWLRYCAKRDVQLEDDQSSHSRTHDQGASCITYSCSFRSNIHFT